VVQGNKHFPNTRKETGGTCVLPGRGRMEGTRLGTGWQKKEEQIQNKSNEYDIRKTSRWGSPWALKTYCRGKI